MKIRKIMSKLPNRTPTHAICMCQMDIYSNLCLKQTYIEFLVLANILSCPDLYLPEVHSLQTTVVSNILGSVFILDCHMTDIFLTAKLRGY